MYGAYAPLMARQLDYQEAADSTQRQEVWALVKDLPPAAQEAHAAAFVRRLAIEEDVAVLRVAVPLRRAPPARRQQGPTTADRSQSEGREREGGPSAAPGRLRGARGLANHADM